VPNQSTNTVTVVRASSGIVLATLTGNGLNQPVTAAFDGERILVTNFGGNSVSLWKAADLSPLGSVSTGASTRPTGACSDGLNFWITLNSTGKPRPILKQLYRRGGVRSGCHLRDETRHPCQIDPDILVRRVH
jgi:DNA-binding beta-propeller fold protein YncE